MNLQTEVIDAPAADWCSQTRENLLYLIFHEWSWVILSGGNPYKALQLI